MVVVVVVDVVMTGAAVVVVVVVEVVVVLVVVVVVGVPAHTNKALDNKYKAPPLVPGSPCEPLGINVCVAAETNPAINDDVTA